MARSVIEGATFAMRDCLEIIQEMKVPVKEVRLSGGEPRVPSGVSCRLTSTGSRLPQSTPAKARLRSRGAAGCVGTGTFKNVVEACDATIQVTDSWTPEAKIKKIYDAAYPCMPGCIAR